MQNQERLAAFSTNYLAFDLFLVGWENSNCGCPAQHLRRSKSVSLEAQAVQFQNGGWQPSHCQVWQLLRSFTCHPFVVTLPRVTPIGGISHVITS